jgi:hypothetical protein
MLLKNTYMAATKMSGEATKMETWMVTYMSRRMSSELQAKWKIIFRFTGIEKWYGKMLEFLQERECDAIKVNEKAKIVDERISINSNGQKSMRPCDLCRGGHWLRACNQFLDMNVQQRTLVVKNSGLCENCLGRSHNTMQCLSRYSCQRCGLRHHLLLCGERKKKCI